MSERLVSVMPRALQEGVAVVQTMRCRRSAAHCAAMRICGKMKGIWRGCDHRDGRRTWPRGARALVAIEPRFGPVIAAGPLPLRRRPDGFAALLSVIVAQAGLDRECRRHLGAGWKPPDCTGRRRFLGAEEEALIACGLSRPKRRCARALAAARIDWAGLRAADTETVVETLTAVPGVGRWTAEIYAKFALGHADVFAAGDLALQDKRAAALPACRRGPPSGNCAPWRRRGARCARLLPGRSGSTNRWETDREGIS